MTQAAAVVAPAAGAAPAGGAAPAAPTGVPAPPAWLPGADAATIALVATKGWSDPAAVIQSYTHLEKFVGADKGTLLQLPSEGADQKTLDAFYSKLGRPENVEKYGVKAADISGMPEDAAKGLLDVAFKEGLTTKQLVAIKDWNNATGTSLQAKLEADAKIEFGQQEAKLKQEWGAAYDQNAQQAKEAAAKLGWTKQQIDAMQISLGYDGVMKLAHSMGVKTGEGQFIQGAGGRQGGAEGVMTPQQAQTTLNKLVDDKQFMAAWQDKAHPGHADAVAKKAQLSAWAAAA